MNSIKQFREQIKPYIMKVQRVAPKEKYIQLDVRIVHSKPVVKAICFAALTVHDWPIEYLQDVDHTPIMFSSARQIVGFITRNGLVESVLIEDSNLHIRYWVNRDGSRQLKG